MVQMFMTLVLIATVLLATLSLPAALHAQSLADVAKKSEAQRGKGEATSDAKAGNPTSIGSAVVGSASCGWTKIVLWTGNGRPARNGFEPTHFSSTAHRWAHASRVG
jgi:hypothetical protein